MSNFSEGEKGYSIEKYDYKCYRDLEYVTSMNDDEKCKHDTGSYKQMLDLYVPRLPDTSKVPIVVFVHGGGWRRGDRKAYRHYMSAQDTNLLVAMMLASWGVYENVGKAFARSGIACAVVSYRLSRLRFPYDIFELLLSFVMTMAIITWPILICSWISAYYFFTNNPYSLAITDCIQIACSTMPILFLTYWFCRHILTLKRLLLLLGIFAVFLKYMIVILPVRAHIYFGLCYFITAAVTICLLRTPGFKNSRCEDRDNQDFDIRHPSHVNDVACSINWVKEHGRKTNLFNYESIYLCGHSAGGHIISLLALDPSYLNRIGLKPSDIKAVISISGVYDLFWLSSSFLKAFYLGPAFGHDPNIWENASPCNHVQQRDQCNDNNSPIFLVINAQYDFRMLRKDANRFASSLKKNGVECKQIMVQGRNHFTIIRDFGLKDKYRCGTIEETCVKFVHECEFNPNNNCH